MRSLSLTLSILTSLLLAIPCLAEVQGEGVLDQFRTELAEGKTARPLVMDGELNGVAQSAFGMVISGGNVEAKLALEFAGRSGMYNEAILTIVQNQPGKINEWVDALIRLGPYGQRMAAAMLLAHQQGVLVRSRKAAIITDYQGDNAKIKQAKKVRGKGKAVKITVPEGLIKSGDPNTAAMAITAAAYAKDASVAGAVKERALALRILGAKNLYLASIGEPVEAANLQKALGARDNFITKPGRKLLDLHLALPDASTTCEAIALIGDKQHLPLALKSTSHPDIRVQIEAVRAIKAINDPAALPTLAKLSQTCSWPVLIEVADAMGQMPDKRSLKPLITRFGRERGRMREDLTHALASIVGSYQGSTAGEWATWFKRNGSGFTVDPAATKRFRETHVVQEATVQNVLYFYGLKIRSDRFSFVIDSSASMKGMRIYSLRKNLHDTCQAMKSYINYNIVDFGGDVCVMYPGTLTNEKAMGMDRARNMPLTLATRTYDGIDAAFDLGLLDTVVLLTDGAPVRSKAKGWDNMMLGWCMNTRYQQCALLAVDFDPSPQNQSRMIRFISENTGQHESIAVADEDMSDERFIRKGDGGKKK